MNKEISAHVRSKALASLERKFIRYGLEDRYRNLFCNFPTRGPLSLKWTGYREDFVIHLPHYVFKHIAFSDQLSEILVPYSMKR